MLMLHYAVASSLRVHGDSSRDGSERSLALGVSQFGKPKPAAPNSRLTIWVYRWPRSWSNCRASRSAATGSRSYAVRSASFSQCETLGSARISLRIILTFTARIPTNLGSDSASPGTGYLLQSSSSFVHGCYSGCSALFSPIACPIHPSFTLANPSIPTENDRNTTLSKYPLAIMPRPGTPPSTQEYYPRDRGKIRAGCRG
jgi:hypothetical protein